MNRLKPGIPGPTLPLNVSPARRRWREYSPLNKGSENTRFAREAPLSQESRTASSWPAFTPRPLPNSSLFGEPLNRSTRSRVCRGDSPGRTPRAVNTEIRRATLKQFPTVGADRNRGKLLKGLVQALIKRPFNSLEPAVTKIPPCRSVFSPPLPPTSDIISAIWDLEGRHYEQTGSAVRSVEPGSSPPKD